ncbi:hypothetical protein SS50377_26210 [Spironucleus salmonicida]|uniref:Uncharacterized protein n=1 Tax=Spironucleus salmonicida TaxID=348837 RepID=V6LED8_9EUKA|nr:hypothetical protein SS50377_26210 [Spironucleus salmonicida]|eukprot:EST42842.1 Hypothetical protein SS50377_17528 [Spironucleus salmonicida]
MKQIDRSPSMNLKLTLKRNNSDSDEYVQMPEFITARNDGERSLSFYSRKPENLLTKQHVTLKKIKESVRELDLEVIEDAVVDNVSFQQLKDFVLTDSDQEDLQKPQIDFMF